MKRIIILLLFVIAALTTWRFFGALLKEPQGFSSSVKWHVSFSKSFSSRMGLYWKENYLAILDDLKPRAVRIPIYWPEVEEKAGQYFWDDYDWMVREAQKRNIKLTLVVGRKLPRWPECFLPDWVLSLNQESQQNLLLGFIKEAVTRYKDAGNLMDWQVENEPFLPFGSCSLWGGQFLDQEINQVKSLDSRHKIIITDGGEWGIWFPAAKRGDIFGTTMYRIIWSRFVGYFTYPLPPKYFWVKANLIRFFYPNKPIIVSELQAEPWGPKLLYEISLEEQTKTMNLQQFSDNIEYARAVGFPEVYLWGAEWWYWMKVKNNHPEFWTAAKDLISSQ